MTSSNLKTNQLSQLITNIIHCQGGRFKTSAMISHKK